MILSLGSCHNQDNKPQEAEVVNVKPVIRDSVVYKGQIIYLDAIDSNEFLKLPAYDLDTNTLYYKTKVIDDSNVYFIDSIIPVLRFTNGDSVVLRPTGSEVNREDHRYVKRINELNSYCILNDALSYDYSIWNKATGKETHVYSYPLESPNGKHFLCYSFCVNGDYAYNGFQVFLNEKDNLHLNWQVVPKNWGPEECRWKDDHTIYMKILYLDSISLKTKYVSLKLPDFTK